MSVGTNFDWDFPDFPLGNYSSSDFPIEKLRHGDDETNFETIVGIAVVFSAATGIFANFLVILLSFGHVQGDFRFFVANLALVDILCGSVFMFMGYINVNDDHHIPSQFLYYMTLAFYGSFGTMICAIVPISLSRVLALSNASLYSTCFGGRRSLIFCIFLDFLPVCILYLICVVEHDVAKVLFYIFAFITTLAYFVAFTTNYMVFRVVAKHIQVVENLHDQARLLETRQVAIATLAQAIIPLFCQVPAFLTLSSVLLLSEPITNGHVIITTQLWLALSPFLDAVITIIVIKQYRKNCLTCASTMGKRIWKPKNTDALYTEEKEAFETRL
ncbi:G_PROTEIN_RECEP_F1_2 domain-containing protein [Caenorhabditis elegans]|uniref:G_PROTEIN_RECEP_F1_2 domain-containing protein n=1 Tax=Caenorhabditis elegans TaxID=6239 RepID=Q19779_CAEEL|nr:G_PROTEIN_RECEP_F1_2 domain-containing protein [Caenorhabditis elegans]CCD69982.1 G_PROTEIN_RECEP_F1_2 domain-containing protein [Caenorhabditis elegans]|eukprot:NP_508157.1 GPCR Thermal Receptor [Caenorhabditis elegans]